MSEHPSGGGRGGGHGRPVRSPLIMVGFDLSPSSEHALAYAAGICARMRGSLLVVHVTTFASLGGLTTFEGPHMQASRTQQVQAVRELVEEILCDTAPGDWELTVAVGEPATILERIAVERDADMIVVGRSRLPARHILGSVPARLVRHAARPITVVP